MTRDEGPVRVWVRRWQVLVLAALGVGLLGPAARDANARPDWLPPGYTALQCRPDSMVYGKCTFEIGFIGDYSYEWTFDGVPQQGTLRYEHWDGSSHWGMAPRDIAYAAYSVTVLDGKEHTVVAAHTDLATGKVGHAIKVWRAPRQMTVRAPLQSAKIARKRGILVRVTGEKGFYRASSKSKRIPGSGNARVLTGEGNGTAAIRLKGKYFDRIRPGQKITVEARHLKGRSTVERATVVVAFT